MQTLDYLIKNKANYQLEIIRQIKTDEILTMQAFMMKCINFLRENYICENNSEILKVTSTCWEIYMKIYNISDTRVGAYYP